MSLLSLHEELACQYVYEKSGEAEAKDIIIIVHDQLDYIQKCINSLYKNTKNFTLYLWDNNSLTPTKEYLEEVASTHKNVVLIRYPENIGFIKPNNELVKIGKNPYIILLNSDTEVAAGWDTALIGWLKSRKNCKITGYQGGLVEEDGKGTRAGWGKNIDYVCGWCLCVHRETYEQNGLFDEENLSFAYCEDSDFSFRMKEKGWEVYALHANLVKHYGNATVMEVQKEMDTSSSFESNHMYIRKRHCDYLKKKRVFSNNFLLTEEESGIVNQP